MSTYPNNNRNNNKLLVELSIEISIENVGGKTELLKQDL